MALTSELSILLEIYGNYRLKSFIFYHRMQQLLPHLILAAWADNTDQ
jgi:hypothetical protein